MHTQLIVEINALSDKKKVVVVNNKASNFAAGLIE